MSKANQNDRTDDPGVKSSMSVSQKVICEDEACLGKVVRSVPPTADETARTDKKKPAGSSMAIGGKEICSDDACIGKD